jgi:hypothetical protein
MAFEDLRGRSGNVVLAKSRNGLYSRGYVIPRNPNTNAQETARANFGRAARTFKTLTASQVDLWEAYASTITFRDGVTGEEYHPTAINAFVEVAAKFLQANPTGQIPLTPPSGPFLGDNIQVTATANLGKITFSASAGNGPNTKTELLLQRLRGEHWTPQPNAYRSRAFVAFASGSLSADVPVTPGFYAAAYRFVNTVTGQATELRPLGVRQVTLSVAAGKSKAA